MMKRFILAFFSFFFIVSCVYADRPQKENLYKLVKQKPLQVYLDDFRSETKKISAQDFKKILEETMLARKTEHFEFVKEGADIIIKANIIFYRYLEKDPVDFLVGTGGIISDAIISKNYVQVKADFSVSKANTGRLLWSKKVEASITESNMPENESIPRVLHRCAKQFIIQCFSKTK